MQRHADDQKADGVVGGIAEEIRRVRLQRCRSGGQASPYLDENIAAEGTATGSRAGPSSGA